MQRYYIFVISHTEIALFLRKYTYFKVLRRFYGSLLGIFVERKFLNKNQKVFYLSRRHFFSPKSAMN